MAVLLASAVIGMTSQNVIAGAPTNWPDNLDKLNEAGVKVSDGDVGGG